MISIIIPCYNCARTVGRAFNSVVNQTFEDWELLLVDNNSADNTLDVLIQLQKQFPEKVKVLYEQKPGATCARNKGLYAAKGDWIQFLDASDEIAPTKLEVQHAKAIQYNPNFIVGSYTRIGTYLDVEINESYPVAGGEVWSALIKSKLGVTSSNLWNRHALIAVKGWDTSLLAAQEYDLMFRLLKLSTSIAYDAENSTTVHILPNETSVRGSGTQQELRILESKINLRRRIKSHLVEQDLLTTECKDLLDLYLFEDITRTYRYTNHHISHLQEFHVPSKNKIFSYLFRRKIDLQRLMTTRSLPLIENLYH
jgi:glycosyltransferase involved in cell wall biosynthesis